MTYAGAKGFFDPRCVLKRFSERGPVVARGDQERHAAMFQLLGDSMRNAPAQVHVNDRTVKPASSDGHFRFVQGPH